MRLVEAYKKNQLDKIWELYHRAFPIVEQKSISLMLKRREEDKVEILSIEDDEGVFLGLAIVACYDDLVLLDYFAISSPWRGNGVGGTAFQMLKERYSNKRLFLEIESTEISSDNEEERIRRKSFYLKNGMTNLPFTVNLSGVVMEVLANACTLDFDEYYGLYYETYGSDLEKTVTMIS